MIYLNEIDPSDSNIRNWKFHSQIGSGLVRARSKRSKEDSLPQETGRAKSSRYTILLKAKGNGFA